MDAKKELLERLCALGVGKEAEIEGILAGYSIKRESAKMKCNLQKRIASFLAAKKIDGLSPRTLKSYRDNLNAFAKRVDKHVANINADDIREYIGYLVDRGLADTTLQLHVNILRTFFAWLTLEEIIKRNPMLKIKSIKVDKLRARRPLTAEQLERYEPLFYYLDQDLLDALNEAKDSPDYDFGAFTTRPDPKDPEAMENPVPVGLYLNTASAFLESYYITGDAVLAIPVNNDHRENTCKFIDFILQPDGAAGTLGGQ